MPLMTMAALFAGYWAYENLLWGDDIGPKLYVGVLSTILGFCVSFLPVLIIGILLPKRLELTSNTELVRASTGSGVSGSFFLGSGTVNSSIVYRYAIRLNNGAIQFKTITSGNVMIFEEDREDGLLKTYTEEFTNKFFNLFAICMGDQTHEIYVPKGSVQTEYEFS